MDPSVDSIGQNHPAFRPENGSVLAAAGPCLVGSKIQKVFKIFRRITYVGTCMKY
jgi:hypothetical protein